MLDYEATREVGRQEHACQSSEGAAMYMEAHLAPPTKSRKRTPTRYTYMHYICIYAYIHAHCIAQHIAPLIKLICGDWSCRMIDDTTGCTPF